MVELDIEQGNDIILDIVQLKGLSRCETFENCIKKGQR